jgi:predicted P-loop ATPase/GTPase
MNEEIVKEEKKLSKEEKLKKISAEKRRLTKLFHQIDQEMIKTVKSLIENASFMAVTLQDLQDEINISGCVATYQNGENQWGTKKSPEVEIYNSMIKNHMQVMKQLTDLLPKTPSKVEDDGYDDFVQTRED